MRRETFNHRLTGKPKHATADWPFSAAILAVVAGSVFAVFANLEAAAWWTVGAATYLACCAICLVAQTERGSRNWLCRLLQDPNFVHAYQAGSKQLMRRLRVAYSV